jgi:hypothetical protein
VKKTSTKKQVADAVLVGDTEADAVVEWYTVIIIKI